MKLAYCIDGDVVDDDVDGDVVDDDDDDGGDGDEQSEQSQVFFGEICSSVLKFTKSFMTSACFKI